MSRQFPPVAITLSLDKTAVIASPMEPAGSRAGTNEERPLTGKMGEEKGEDKLRPYD